MSGGGGGRDDGYTPLSTPVVGGGSVGSGGGGGGSGGTDPCDIVEIVPLNSPQSAVVAGLKPGDVLSVNLNQTGSHPVLEVLDPSGRRAGSLTHRGHLHIISCIGTGRAYQAVVTSRNGGAIDVRIEPV